MPSPFLCHCLPAGFCLWLMQISYKFFAPYTAFGCYTHLSLGVDCSLCFSTLVYFYEHHLKEGGGG